MVSEHVTDRLSHNYCRKLCKSPWRHLEDQNHSLIDSLVLYKLIEPTTSLIYQFFAKLQTLY